MEKRILERSRFVCGLCDAKYLAVLKVDTLGYLLSAFNTTDVYNTLPKFLLTKRVLIVDLFFILFRPQYYLFSLMTVGGGERNLPTSSLQTFSDKILSYGKIPEYFKTECIELAIFMSLQLKNVYCLKCKILCEILSL